jgi:hypothetical protein
MGLVGADVDQMHALARTFEQAAERLDAAAATVTGTLSSVSWSGPDAERHRGQWHGESRAAMRSVAAALREAASVVARNASEQEQASAARSGASTGPLTPAVPQALQPILPHSVDGQPLSPLVDIRDFLNSNLIWPVTWGTQLGAYDRLGVIPLIDALGLASDSRLSHEDKIIQSGNAVTDLVGGLIKGNGGAVGYLGGVAVQQWGDVIANAAKADFSASGMQTVTDYIAKDPGGAFGAAAEAVKNYVPKLFSNLLP